VSGALATLERPGLAPTDVERREREAVWDDESESSAAQALSLEIGVLGGETVPERPRISVAVVAPSPAVRAGLADFLERAGYEVVDVTDAELEETGRPDDLDGAGDVDVVVADLDDALGLEGASDVLLRAGELPVVFLASGLDADADASVRRAATGWLRRDASADELDAAVRAVAAGLDVVGPGLRGSLVSRGRDGGEPSPLTEREREVLELVASGLPNKGIARALGISEHTVKFHVGAVLSKLEAQSRTEAVSIAARRGLMTL